MPFFILAGNLMNIAGITGRIYNFAVALVGWMKGGLGQVNIIGSVIFSGMGQKPNPIYLKAGDAMRLGIEGLGEQHQSVHAWDPALIDG